MTHNDFEEYKKAIKSKYESEKNGAYSSFLLSPSRANLRKLCAERFGENTSAEDLAVFKQLFRFDFGEGYNKLKNETGRFRAIENFFKGETDTNEIPMINMAAILVDFSPRPFLKFSKNPQQKSDTESDEEGEYNLQVIKDRKGKKPEKDNKSLKRKILVGSLVLLGIAAGGYTTMNLVSPEKQCMQWQGDHYEPIDCRNEINNLYSSAPIIPFDDNCDDLQKLHICDTTTFFKGGKAVVWYCKVDGKPEFFDGSGFHPITGKALRPVTNYIINKYVKSNYVAEQHP